MKKHTKIYWIGIVFVIALCFCLIYYVFYFNTSKSENPKLKIANNRPNKRGGEYELFPNGLIYSAPTINKLGKIVDSLNLKYKKCESNYDFTSISQTVGCIVLLEKRRVKQAKSDMMNNISFEDFIKKYPKAKYKKEVLILKTKYINFENKEEVSIDYMNLQDYNPFHIVSNEKNVFNKDHQNKWLFKYNKKDEYLDEYIEAFYFPNKFKMVKIPNKYAQKIGYTDCLITPEATIYKTVQKDSLFSLPDNWMELSKKDKIILLDRLRSTRVQGYCGMDTRPREHAVKIALLAAETANWDVFLMAHLNIMNDRFDRRSDNSINNSLRGTYLKELESLNINVTDLLLGSIFQISNPNNNHYFGNVSRIGKALSETKYRGQVEKAIFEVIKDTNVDDYNRFLFYYLFDSYFGNSNEKRDKKVSVNKITVAFKTLPKYFQENFVYKKVDEDF
jgi:hypothetical protein